jgi:hypothetical protein
MGGSRLVSARLFTTDMLACLLLTQRYRCALQRRWRRLTTLLFGVLPRQLVKRRLIAPGAVAVLCDVEFLVLVILDTHTMLIDPAIPLPV